MPAFSFDYIEEDGVDEGVRARPDEPTLKWLRTVWVDSVNSSPLVQLGSGAPYTPSKSVDGGTTSLGRTFEPIWPKLLKWLTEAKVTNIPLYMRSVLHNWKGTPQALHPNILMRPSSLEIYKDTIKRLVGDMRLSLQIQTNIAVSNLNRYKELHSWDADKASREMIDSQVGLSSLFRFCWAAKFNYEDVAAQYRDAALMQYSVASEDYNKIWGDFIPEELRRSDVEVNV